MAENKKNGDMLDRVNEAFSVSVMPKEFRGLEGLARAYAQDPRVEPERPRPVVEPKPMMQKQMTPEAAAKAKLQQHIQKPKKTSWILIGVIVFVVLLFVGIGIAFFAVSTNKEPEVPIAPAPTPVVPVVVPPTPVTQPQVAPPVTPVPDVETFSVLPGQDTDSDGLTDVEEALYGTQLNKPDTDQDGFLDGNEVFHLFHPDGYAPATLLDTGEVSRMHPEGMAFTINVITQWKHTVLTQDMKLMTSASTGETFTVLQHAVPASKSLQQFYSERVPAVDRQNLESFRTKQGYTGIWTQDHRAAFVRFSDDVILEFSYELNGATRIQYRQTFEMFINSLTNGLIEP